MEHYILLANVMLGVTLGWCRRNRRHLPGFYQVIAMWEKASENKKKLIGKRSFPHPNKQWSHVEVKVNMYENVHPNLTPVVSFVQTLVKHRKGSLMHCFIERYYE